MFKYRVLDDPESQNHSNNSDIEEESKSHSEASEVNSLLTEEDTSGNHLSPEAQEMLKKNTQLKKELTNSFMSYKSLSRSLLDSDISLDDPELIENKEKRDSICGNEEEVKNSVKFEEQEKFDMKTILEKTAKLYLELQNTRKKVDENKKEIFLKEKEFSELEQDLKRVGSNLKSVIKNKSNSNECICRVF
jgi:hypothetical protein